MLFLVTTCAAKAVNNYLAYFYTHGHSSFRLHTMQSYCSVLASKRTWKLYIFYMAQCEGATILMRADCTGMAWVYTEILRNLGQSRNSKTKVTVQQSYSEYSSRH